MAAHFVTKPRTRGDVFSKLTDEITLPLFQPVR
jgi:hypothetical protein